MSDTNTSIVPKISNYANNKAKAEEILTWLIKLDVVKSEMTDCTYASDNLGYEISEGARVVTTDPGDEYVDLDEHGKIIGSRPIEEYLPFSMEINGLQIITERSIYISDEGYVESIMCPKCETELDINEIDLDAWLNNSNNYQTCPNCKKEIEVNEFNIDPEWGFSDLGFKFWNWPPFTEEFIEKFKEKLNCEIRVINERL